MQSLGKTEIIHVFQIWLIMYLFSAFVLHQISVDGIPPDGTTFTAEKEIEKPLTIIMYILAILGMILVSVCIGFTAIFHKTRLILCCGFTNMHFLFPELSL